MFEPRTRWIVAEAVQNIQLKRTRVLLTLVGIVISTAAVVAILTIGWNAANESVRRFSALGVNLFVVSNLEQGQALSESRMADEKRALQNTFPFVERVATVFSLSTRVKVHHRQADAVVYAGDELFRPLIAPLWDATAPGETGAWVGAGLIAELGLPAYPGRDARLRIEGRYYPSGRGVCRAGQYPVCGHRRPQCRDCADIGHSAYFSWPGICPHADSRAGPAGE